MASPDWDLGPVGHALSHLKYISICFWIRIIVYVLFALFAISFNLLKINQEVIKEEFEKMLIFNLTAHKVVLKIQ